MILLIDLREPKTLVKYISSLNADCKNKILIEQKNLDIGDFVFYDEINDKPIIIIERKSLSDLESSIKDGRYNEQSFRLNESPTHNHNIIYLIEGAIINYKNTAFKNTLYSTLLSLNYFKGFSIINSLNQIETGDIILAFASKLMRENKQGYYGDISAVHDISDGNYIENVKTSKKAHINSDNILQLMLMQIPGISSISAQALADEFSNMQNLLTSLKNDDLKTEQVKLASGRKINKNIINSLKKFLVH